MTNFVVRKLLKEDIPAILALDHSLDTAPHWRREDYEACLKLPNHFPIRLALVVETNGMIAGFAIAARIFSEAELESLCVATANQRQGVGTQLLAALLNELQVSGVNQVFLEVRPSNVAAIALYHRFDFAEVGRRPRYYSWPEEDAIHMKLHI
jgi:[ribosomal protein S18]-alanine N-acetyltransferase